MHTVRTDPVIKKCEDCGRPFRTYVPETYCELPGGGSVFYCDPQTKCPLCNDNGYGDFMNEDLFPELVPELRPNMSPSTLEPETSWVPNTSDTYCESSFSTQLWLYDGMIIICNAFEAQNSSISNIEGHIITNSFITNTEGQICNLKIHFCEY